MKRFVVKCPSCGQNYFVEPGKNEDFRCDCCGAQNGMEDVIETIDDAEEKSGKIAVEDPDLVAIRSYHDSYFPVMDEREQNAPYLGRRNDDQDYGITIPQDGEGDELFSGPFSGPGFVVMIIFVIVGLVVLSAVAR